MPHPTERTVIVKTSTVLKVIALLMLLWFLWLVRDVLALLFVALFLAGLMYPAARWGAKRRIPKGVTVLAIYIGLFAVLAAAFALVIPTLIQQLGHLSTTIGSSIDALTNGVQNLRHYSEQYGLSSNLTASFASLQEQFGRVTSGLVLTLTNIFGGIAALLIVLVMAFYMVVEEKEAVRMFRNFVPDKYQDFSADLILRVEQKIGKWLTGQLVLSLIIGIFYYIGLLVLGVDSALTLALFGAVTEFIPYLGPLIGGIPVVIVAFGDSPVKALLALGLVIIVQQAEAQIIVPKVMQKAVGLNPLVSIVAVTVGAKLFGLLGVLLAIPITTALSVILTEIYHYRQDQQ